MKLHRATQMRSRNTLSYLVICAGVVLLTGKALAKVRPPVSKDQRDCDAAYEQANQRVEVGHLTEAKELSAKCAQQACGNFLRQACTSLYSQLDAELPSVVPIVTDSAGGAVSLVEVKMDGDVLTSKLNGLSLRIDPGKHDFTFSTDSGVFATRKVMILQGEHNRPISVLLRQPRRRSFVASGRPLPEQGHKAVEHEVAVAALPADDSQGSRSPVAAPGARMQKTVVRRELAESEAGESDVVLVKGRRMTGSRPHHDHSL